MAGNLTPKQDRFVAEYLVDLNATQAAIRAGYSKKTADVQGPRLLGNVRISDEITRRRAVIADKLEITQEWVIKKLVDNVERAMQAEPVLSVDGTPMGVYNYAGSVANGALTLLGKHLGMFAERQITDNTHRIIVEYTDEPDGDDHTD